MVRVEAGGPSSVHATLNTTLSERGFPHVDQWKMTPVHHLSLEGREGFDEVARGYLTDEEVRAEAARCLLCKHPTCISGCPNTNPIPTWLGLVVEGRILDAAVADYEQDSLAACTGRVCNWEEQGEGWCVLNADGQGVRIGAVERYIADYAFRHREEFDRLRAQRAREEHLPTHAGREHLPRHRDPVGHRGGGAVRLPGQSGRVPPGRGGSGARRALGADALGAAEAGGRPRPEPIPGSEYEVPCDMALLAVGYAVHGIDLSHPEVLNRDGAVHTHGGGA